MAIEAYRKAIELNPSKATTMYNLALVYNKTKDYSSAAQYFRMATQANPEYFKAFNSLGVALMNSGKVDQALAAFESALAVKDNYDEAMYRMAAAYNKVGKHQDALNSAKECLKITRKFKAHASFEAGVAAKAIGQKQAAIGYFQEAGKNRQWRKSADYEIESIQKGL